MAGLKFLLYSLTGLLWLAIVVGPGFLGWEYYNAALHDRAYMEIHELLKPTGLIGHGYGVMGTLFLVIGVGTYSLRKRISYFQNWGKLRNWLRFHIFLCTSGPALVLWHTTFKFKGIVAVSFWSMVVVVLSGVLGRYVYNRIPKTENGHFRNLEDLRKEQEDLWNTITHTYSFSPGQLKTLGLDGFTFQYQNPWKALLSTLFFDLKKITRIRSDKRFLSDLSLPDSQLKRTARLLSDFRWKTRQLYLLQPLQKVFTYWHIFHIPLATLMFLILAVHIAVAVAFGYTWIF
jgi:hypothetical protein